MIIDKSLSELEDYIITNDFKGYDPYDTLNSKIPFKKFGKWVPVLATQFQKRNPIHIRPIIGVEKGINPKAYGLFINAFSKMFKLTDNEEYLKKAEQFIEWLNNNRSQGYENACWGYNFDWASPTKLVPAYSPSVVVTAFIVKGLYEYYKITEDQLAKELILSAAKYVYHDLPQYENEYGKCISYTDIQIDVCHNANLLGAEVLSYAYTLNNNENYKELAESSLAFTMAYQKEDGRWNYSLDPETGSEKKQVDFHQGYVLESAMKIIDLCNVGDRYLEQIKKGLFFYKNEQFNSNGRSYWRIPKKYPVEIHNQSQGIITFIKFKDIDSSFEKFAFKIAMWTIENMQHKKGYFYYQIRRFFKIKIPYMRWSQAWMYLALVDLKYYSTKK
ncbi:hypothetical protein [Gracilimonas sp.]|uniref:hypothetical protein n=1 Tax=Gracilimonas sp. TaxID=1974203 RepID=UPI003D0BC4B7